MSEEKKQKPKKSLFDHAINIICILILGYFVCNEFSHLYRNLDSAITHKDKFSRHYTLSTSFPFVGSYYLALPENYNPKYKYPLAISLHGIGTRAYSAEVLMSATNRKRFPFFVMMPLAPPRAFWGTPENSNYALPRMLWFPDHLPLVVKGARDIMNTYNIDRERILLTGHSMGGAGVIAGLERYPGLFTGGVASAPIWSPEEISNIKAPLLVFHGLDDAQISANYSKELQKSALQQQKPMYFSFLPGQGHGIGAQVYNDEIWALLLKTKKPS